MAGETTVNGIRYDLSGSGNNAKAVVLKYADGAPYSGDVVIPGTIVDGSKSYSVTEVKFEAFSECPELTSVSLPASITNLGVKLFMNSTALKSVKLHEFMNIFTLPGNLFEGCTALDSITIPDGFQIFSASVFKGCTSLKKVNFSQKVYLIGGNCFEGCSMLDNVVIPAAATTIGNNCFKDCTSLKNIVFESATVSINDNAFEGCTALETITLPTGFKYLNKEVFKGCTSLKGITFPATTERYLSDAFAGCTSLQWVSVEAETPVAPYTNYSGTTFSPEGAFDASFLTDGTLYVPDASVDAYKAADGWKEFANIKGISEKADAPDPDPVDPDDPDDPYKGWKAIGMSKFYDPFMNVFFGKSLAVYPRIWEVMVYESEEQPGLFRMVNPYLGGECPYFEASDQGCDILVNATNPDEVYISTQGLGFCPNYSYGDEMWISTTAGRHIENGVYTHDEIVARGEFGSYADGIIKISWENCLASLPLYDDGDYYRPQQGYDFILKLPGAKDFQVDLYYVYPDDYEDRTITDCSNTGKVRMIVEKTADVASMKYLVSYNNLQVMDEISEIVAAEGKDIEEGLTEISVDPKFVGRATVYVVGLNDQGKVRCAATRHYDFVNDETYGPWKSLGYTNYEDAIIMTIYEVGMLPAYKVEVQESESIPGLYRLVNVYTQESVFDKYNMGNLHNHDFNHYLYVNATDPSAVYVEPSPIGFAANDGSMFLIGGAKIYLDNGYSIETIKALTEDGIIPEMFGTLTKRPDGDVILMPANSIYAAETHYQDGSYYVANSGLDVKIVLPSATGIENIQAPQTEEDEYYDLRGIRHDKPVRGSLMIKMGQDGKAKKAIIK